MKWLPVMPSMGVNLFDAPESIRDNECRKAKNLVASLQGRLHKRPTLARPYKAFSSVPTEKPVSAIISPITNSPIDLVVVVREPDGSAVRLHAQAVATFGVGSAFTQPFWASRPHVLAWNGRAYLLPGPYAVWSGSSKYPFYVMSGQPGSGSDDVVVNGLAFAGSGNENVFPAYAFPYKRRLVLAHFGKGYENTIAFTDDGTADVVGNDLLASNGRSISLVAGADGDEIVGGIEVMLTNVGSPAEAGLLILRRYGTPFLLTGDMDQTGGGTSTLDIKQISINCGCSGQHTVVRTPVGIIWAGADDVWAFAAGVLPTRIGQKIQPALKLTPAQLQYAWTGVYFDGFYRLSVWGEGQPMDLASPPGDQWWLDLREGLPENWRAARWWGPQQFLGGASIASPTPTEGIWLSFVDTRANKDQKIYYIDHEPGVGSTIGEYTTGGRDLTAQTTDIPDMDYVDPEVTVELVTKEFQLQPPYLQINDGIAFAAHSSSNVRLSTDFVLDNGEYKYTTSKSMTAEGFLTGSGRLNQGKLYRKQQAASFYPSNRRAAMQHRFRIYETAGWVIVPTYNDCLVVVMVDNISGIDYQTIPTIAQGAYSSTDLVTAVIAAVNAAKLFGGDWSATYAAGVPTFVGGGPYATSVTQQVKFAGTSAPTQGTTATQAQLDACRRLMAIMGFLTSSTNLNSTGLNPSIAGVTAPFKKGASRLEMHSLQAQFEVIPREP